MTSWRTCSIVITLSGLVGLMHTAAGAPMVIAHRGASAYLPEHTLEAYAMAHAMGADYIEPDLVMTKDGRLICLHDIHLEATTDVKERFPDRKREDGRWYAADFTLAEIKSMKALERLPNRFPIGHARFEVPTFEEMIQLVQGLNKTTGRNAGIYPELKDPSWHRKAGLPLEEACLEILTRYGYTGPEANVFIQCFEPDTLKRLRHELKSQLPMIALISDHRLQDNLVTGEGLEAIATYANGIGPDKRRIEKDPELVKRAQARGLQVHPYTLRADMFPPKYGSFEEELRQYYIVWEVDALFTDNPDIADQVLTREGKRLQQNPASPETK